MSISVNFINGARGSICNNDAFAIVKQENGETRVLDFIPAYEVPGKTRADIEDAFAKAAANGNNNTETALKADAYQRLGLAPTPN